jgi:hypothetical protein
VALLGSVSGTVLDSHAAEHVDGVQLGEGVEQARRGRRSVGGAADDGDRIPGTEDHVGALTLDTSVTNALIEVWQAPANKRGAGAAAANRDPVRHDRGARRSCSTTRVLPSLTHAKRFEPAT